MEHIEYDRNVSAAISAKLATAQKVHQKDAEVRIAERDAEIARTLAKGTADSVRIQAEGESAAMVLKGEAQKKAKAEITRTLSAAYLRYKAFDGSSTRFYFVPVGKDGMPIIVDAGGEVHAAFARPIMVELERLPSRPGKIVFVVVGVATLAATQFALGTRSLASQIAHAFLGAAYLAPVVLAASWFGWRAGATEGPHRRPRWPMRRAFARRRVGRVCWRRS